MNFPFPQARRASHKVLLSVLVFCCGCGVARPVKYYALNNETTPVNSSDPRFPVTILVARLTSSHLYRDDRLVYEAGPVELGTYEYQRWAASPVDMLQQLLISSLRSTGQYRSVAAMGSNAQGDYILRGHLDALDEVDEPQLAARFAVDLELYDPHAGATLWTGSYSHEEPVTGKKVPDVVEAIDKDVRAGVQQLTVSLGEYFSSHPQHPSGSR